ncbi:MAG: ribonuclease III [Anaerolineae bacterium]|nr:MAG: ribonuclease III [Anaerolineae bacterium]
MQPEPGDLGLETPQEFAKRLNLPIQDRLLFARALTHRSYLNENPEALEDNERLEFLGDAVLDFVVGAWLYNRFPEMSEGDMTRLRAALVRTEALAEFAREVDIGRALRLGRGEEDGGGRVRLAMLCAAFEAVVGALYLDSGVYAVEAFMAPLLEHTTDHILINHHDRDPKSLLQEWAQANGHRPPLYRIVAEAGPDHEKTFDVEVVVGGEVLGQGQGSSKQAASKVAAQMALEKIDG